MNTQRVEGHTPTPAPCPFCGKTETVFICSHLDFQDEEISDYDDGYRAYNCDFNKGGCGASSGFAPNEAEALENWNRRAPIERLEKVNEALVESLAEAIKWIENAPEDAWGYANDGHARWPLRDELVSKLRKALAKEPA